MTTNIGNLAVSLSLDARSFNGSVEQVNRNLGAMGSELKASKALGMDYGKSVEGLASKKDILSRSVEASSAKLKIERKLYDEMAASGKSNEIEMERQAKRVNEAQAQYNRLATELAAVDKALKVQSSSWTQYGEKMEAAGTKMQSVGKGMSDVGGTLTKSVTLPFAAMSTGAFKAAVDFESAFAGVRKTVDGTEAEFAILSSGIRDMAKELPTAATEIAGIAEAAGQLGIKKEAILGFTRTMADLGVATNMSSDEAATALARFANITQMSQSDFDRLGSSVVELGNNFATTEREIVEMSLRLAGAGAQVGMSEADILALATALSSVGIEAEMGGSAISRVMVNMQVATSTGFTKVEELLNKTGYSLRDLQMMASHSGKAFGNLAEDLGMTKKELSTLVDAGLDLQNFSKVAGMTGEQFKQAFEKDAIGALGAFINGLANAEEAGDSAINMLQEMGITEIRLRDSLLRAGGASELFANAVELSNDAWDENNALTKEAEERYKTTASQMKILWNNVKDVGITMGNVLIPVAQDAMNKFKPLVETFAAMDKEQHKTILTMGLLAASVGPTLKVTGNLTNTLGGTLLMASRLSKGVGAAGGLAPALAAIAGPGAIAVGALAAVGVAGYGLYKVLNKTSIPEIDIFGEKVSENSKKAVGAFTKLSDEASVQLNGLKWSGVKVSKEMATEIINSFDKMGDSVLAEMKNDHASQLETARGYFANSVSLTAEEQQGLLDKVVEGQKKRETAIQTAQTQYSSILQNAADERRSITALEQDTLDRLQREMLETGIKYLSESEEESLVILERLKLESGKISSEQAIETSKRARESRDAVVEEAEKKYEETIAFAMLLKEEGSKESKEAADIIIADAQRTRDEAIAAANGQYETVISIAKEKGDEYVTETELRLGEVQTLWQKAAWNISTEAIQMSATVVGEMKTMSVDSGVWIAKLKNDSIESFAELVRGSKLAMEKLPGIVREMMTEAALEAAKSIVEFYKVGEDIIEGLKMGMANKAGEVSASAYNMGKSMVESISKSIGRQSPAKEFIAVSEDAGDGLIIGMQNRLAAVKEASKATGTAMVTSLQATLVEGTKKVNTEVAEIEKKAAEETAKIAKRAAEDIALIHSKAKKSKHGMTQAENIRLHRLEEDSAAKINKINEKAAADVAKILDGANKNRLNDITSFISNKKKLEQISLQDEVAIWKESVKQFKDGTDEKQAAQLMLRDAKRAVDQDMLDSGIAYIDEKKRLGQISLQGEIRLLDELSTHFEQHSMKYETIQKRKAQVVKQVNEDVTKINESFSAKMVDINKKMADGILKVNEELASKTKSINERLAADTLKAKEELASKSKAISDRLIADELRVNDEYVKAVDDKYKSLLNSMGLFDKFDMSPKQTGNELFENLKSQVEGVESWEEEIAKLSSEAIDEGLLADLRAMGPKALPQLKALNSMTEEQLQEYSAMYQKKSSQARAAAEKEMAGMKEDTQRRLEELRSVANAELTQLNNDTYARINEMRRIADAELAQLRNDANIRITEMRTAANEQLTVLKTEWVKEINNVTKATDEEFKSLTAIGKQAGQNLLDGLASMESSLVSKAQSIAAAVNAALQSALGGSADLGVTSSVNGSRDSGSSSTKTYTANSTINIYAPTASASEIARKNQQLQRDLGMQW